MSSSPSVRHLYAGIEHVVPAVATTAKKVPGPSASRDRTEVVPAEPLAGVHGRPRASG
jgi:hypothetical protein